MRHGPRVAAAASLLLLSGCASAATSGSSSSGGPMTATPSPSVTTPRTDRAVVVVFERSGGKTGRADIRRFAANAPPPKGATKARLREVLSVASRPSVRSMHLALMPQILCCDRYTYTVRVTYGDGASRIFRTADGLHQPPPLRHLISALS